MVDERLYRSQRHPAPRSTPLRKRSNSNATVTSLPNLLLTDFLTFRWYVNGELRQEAQLAQLDSSGRLIRPARGSRAGARHCRATARLPRTMRPQPVNNARGVGQAPRPPHAPDSATPLSNRWRVTTPPTCCVTYARPSSKRWFPISRQKSSPTCSPKRWPTACSRPAATTPDRRRSSASAQQPKSPRPTLFSAGSSTPSPARTWTMSAYAGFVDDLAQLLADTDMDNRAPRFRSAHQARRPRHPLLRDVSGRL